MLESHVRWFGAESWPTFGSSSTARTTTTNVIQLSLQYVVGIKLLDEKLMRLKEPPGIASLIQ